MIMQADGEQGSRNPNGSTGPRTAEGKERVKFNAVTHGLTARHVVLPGEDPEAYQATVDFVKAGLGTRNPFEDKLAARAAQASWMADRATRSETARLTARMLTEPAAEVVKQFLEADSLFQRLMFDRRGPTELYPARDYDHKQPRTSASGEPVDLDHPRRLVPQLEATLPGCRLLLQTWGELGGLLRSGRGWQSPDKLKGIRLMGRQPTDATCSDEVALIFLAAHVIEPQARYPFQELRCEISEDEFKRFKGRVERRELDGITPADATAGRAVLLEIVDKAIERLRKLEAEHQKVADQLEAVQMSILSEDRSKTGEQFNRLLGSCSRLELRNIDAIHKIRRNEEQGWGRVRDERAQRKEERRREEERRRGIEADSRLVLDEHGTFRYAYDYEGDVEQGLARYEARFGKAAAQANAACGPVGAEMRVGAMPDLARRTPPTVDFGVPVGALQQPDASGEEVTVEPVVDEVGDVGEPVGAASRFEGEASVARGGWG